MSERETEAKRQKDRDKETETEKDRGIDRAARHTVGCILYRYSNADLERHRQASEKDTYKQTDRDRQT